MSQLSELVAELREIHTSDELFDRMSAFLRNQDVNEDEKLLFILFGFYYRRDGNSSRGIIQEQLEPHHHETLSQMVFLSNEILDDQTREELALHVILTVLFQVIQKSYLNSESDDKFQQCLHDYLMNLATFRSFTKIVNVFRFHHELMRSWLSNNKNSGDLHEKFRKNSLIDEMRSSHGDEDLIVQFLMDEDVMMVFNRNDVTLGHQSWLISAFKGLFDLLTSEDQMAFLSLFSKKWLVIYQNIPSDEIIFDVFLQSVLEGVNYRKDVPISILEDVLVAMFYLGSPKLRKKVYQLGWETLRLETIYHLVK